MARKSKNQDRTIYSIDNGKYARFRNEDGKATGIIRREIDVGRNQLCLCNSGKKYKHCCDGKKVFYYEEKKKWRFGFFPHRIKALFGI